MSESVTTSTPPTPPLQSSQAHTASQIANPEPHPNIGGESHSGGTAHTVLLLWHWSVLLNGKGQGCPDSATVGRKMQSVSILRRRDESHGEGVAVLALGN